MKKRHALTRPLKFLRQNQSLSIEQPNKLIQLLHTVSPVVECIRIVLLLIVSALLLILHNQNSTFGCIWLTCAKVNEKTQLHNLEQINTQTCGAYYKVHVNFEICTFSTHLQDLLLE